MGLSHPAYGQVRQVTPSAAVLLANNPNQMTLEGTNSWVLRAPGRSDCVIVDPGPADRGHVRALADVGPIAMTLITHHHHDHTGALKHYVPLTGSAVRSVDPKFLNNSMHPLTDGEVIEAAGLRIQVLATPGHTTDSVSFLVDVPGGDSPAVLTGDTILGRGTTILGSYEGALADYLASLDRLITAGVGRRMLPAHGPEHGDTAETAKAYRAHREERLNQVRDALRALGKRPEEARPLQVVSRVYQDVDKRLWPAARVSVKAQLEYLRDHD